MSRVGDVQYIDFRVVNTSSVPISGLVLANFIVVFRRNNVSCSDALSLTDLTNGEYTVSYTPSSPGHDYIELYNSVNDIRVEFTADIQTFNHEFGITSSTLNQDFPSSGNLTLSGVADPTSFQIQVFNESDWLNGNRGSAFALYSTAVNPDGTWVQSFTCTSGTFTVAAISPSQIVVISPKLVIS